jgi:hypothetical protein
MGSIYLTVRALDNVTTGIQQRRAKRQAQAAPVDRASLAAPSENRTGSPETTTTIG